MYTVHELKEKLKVACDETGILEVLDISVEEILDRFEDKIEAKLESLSEEFEEDFDRSDGEDRSEELSSGDSEVLRRIFPDGGYQIIGENQDEEGMDW